MERQFAVYIVTNKSHSVFYTGFTNGLSRRLYEHKNKLVDGFTKKYNIDKLVYYEFHNNPVEAIAREKQIKDWRREKKFKLIESINPDWEDLYQHLNS